MKTWQVIFKDGQRGSEPIDASMESFDEAMETGLLNGREIIGLRIIGDSTDADHRPTRRDGPSEAAVIRGHAVLVAQTGERKVDGGVLVALFFASFKWAILTAVIVGIWLVALHGCHRLS